MKYLIKRIDKKDLLYLLMLAILGLSVILLLLNIGDTKAESYLIVIMLSGLGIDVKKRDK